MPIIKKDWITESGLRAVVLYVNGSHHCGYVAVDADHLLHGVGYADHSDDLKSRLDEVMSKTTDEHEVNPIALFCYDGKSASPEMCFSVHGGLTYSNASLGELEDDGSWWFGYDCAHAGDATAMSIFPDDVFRDVDFCVDQCEKLATQIAAIQQ